MGILDRIFRRRPVAPPVAPRPIEADLQALRARLAELDASIPELRLLRQDVTDARADIRRLAGEQGKLMNQQAQLIVRVSLLTSRWDELQNEELDTLRRNQQSASAALLSLDQLRREVKDWQKQHERWNQHTLDSVYECERAIKEIKGETGAEEEDDSKWEGEE